MYWVGLECLRVYKKKCGVGEEVEDKERSNLIKNNGGKEGAGGGRDVYHDYPEALQ